MLNISVQISREGNMMSSMIFWSKTEKVATNSVLYTNFCIKILHWSFIKPYLDWGMHGTPEGFTKYRRNGLAVSSPKFFHF